MSSTKSQLIQIIERFWSDDFAPLEAAGNAVLGALRDDEVAPDADLYRRITSSGSGSHMYFPAKTDVASPPTVAMTHQRSVPLPSYLQDQLKTSKFSSQMGLHPESELAWIAVDCKLFIWSYTMTNTREMEDLCSFTIPSGQLIVSVAIVPPKKGVFTDAVEWCLVVTTVQDAIVCALARSSNGVPKNGDNGFSNGLLLIPTSFMVQTDSVPLLTVCGTPDGRIFCGGKDGSLYEMAYEGLLGEGQLEVPRSVEQHLDDFYDRGKSGPSVLADDVNTSIAHQVVTRGKRALASALVGSPPAQQFRPPKCRKLNHSSTPASSVVSAIVPDFLLNAGSAIFGLNATGGGPIVKITFDPERSCLYTLSSKGWICAFDLDASATSPSQIKLAAVMDTPKTARMYLEAVSRGRIYPPTTSQAHVGKIAFPGGASAAQAGVGGMDGARSILKLADLNMKDKKDGRAVKDNILTPVSLHVVPRKESSKLTLVAITRGGLRYLISSLKDAILRSGPAQSFGTDRKTDPLAPDNRLSLCHIRAPPPVGEDGLLKDLPPMATDAGDVVGGCAPKVSGGLSRVVSSFYNQGTFILALEHKKEMGSAGIRVETGNVVVASTPDAVARRKEIPPGQTDIPKAQSSQSTTLVAPGGISETLSLPMLSAYGSKEVVPYLSGGQIWDICMVSDPGCPVLYLTENSKTPTDSELNVGMVTPFASKNGLRTAESAAKDSGRTSTALTTVRPVSTRSAALTLLTNIFLSRPLRYGMSYAPVDDASRRFPPASSYRISTSYGSSGFSLTAADNSRGKGRLISSARSISGTSATPRSVRLSPWLLQPAIVPLNTFAKQHLLPYTKVVSLNAGGLHFFSFEPLLWKLANTLMAAGVNAKSDARVTSFFTSYGYKEGCAMCLALAIGCGPAAHLTDSGVLRARATGAALEHAYKPKLFKLADVGSGGTVEGIVTSTDSAVPVGYEFRPSQLYSGLTTVISRLLRPVWYKPAVVVTEGRTIRRRASSLMNVTPAKVELLLDDVTLEEVRKPLHSLQKWIKNTLSRAVSSVPGLQRKDMDMMDVESNEEQFGYLTGAIQLRNQARSASGGNDGHLLASEAEEIARLLEERNIHSLYRMLSRTVQLLSLMALLKRAHFQSGLPGVEWGLLHGLTVSQLVNSRDGQERLENLLNSLVTSSPATAGATTPPSAESDQLASALAQQCFLFFSPGARFAYLGFRSAHEALECAPSSSRRAVLTKSAAMYLRCAARHWYSAPLIAGRLLQAKGEEGYEQIALRAAKYDSPLAKAVKMLLELEDVAGVVDVCLITASHFGGTVVNKEISSDEIVLRDDQTSYEMTWEKDLYHKRRAASEGNEEARTRPTSSSSTTTQSNALALGATVTARDALSACHALIFYNLSELLKSRNALGDRMVSACAAAKDKAFLEAFFTHLLRGDHKETLLRIDSPDLENWLLEQQEDSDILWQYYDVQDKHMKAGEVCWKRACNVQLGLRLSERINCLTRALAAYQTYLKRTTSGYEEQEVQQTVNQIKETLAVSEVQNRILRAVDSMASHEMPSEKYDRLSSALVPISDLYNDFAAPLGLFEFCLEIFHVSRHVSQQDGDVIRMLWKSIICSEVLPCSTRSEAIFTGLRDFSRDTYCDEEIELISQSHEADNALFENGDWLKKVEGRILLLGEYLYQPGEDYVFPIDFLVSCLEDLRRLWGAAVMKTVAETSLGWPMKVMVGVGVPYLVALGAYEGIIGKDRHGLMGGINPNGILDHLASIVELLHMWVSSAQGAVATTQSNSSFDQLSDAVRSGRLMARIDACKAQLDSLPPHCEAVTVYDRLVGIEDTIKQLT